MTTVNRKIIAPRPHPETEPFWQAAGEGQLLVKKCGDCGEVHYYPRAICPHCLSGHTEWLTASGRGTIYSYSTMGKAESAYTLAYVTLDEGVTMLTNLIDCDPAALAIGQSVSVVFVPTEGGPPVPMFRPA
ncbi:OB-fold domain-containing protein [Aromatoleum toluclasticum]|uniref:Zn-ribbon domain-containing OB-fold protein n=1 Tax=Aromatoleum toluclasticum TaxID=92003 RepID=UPI001D197025|nr:OB-fold domain-containing protein [Aromatoleum toluclasticum]MCC4114958.1 OB-fold domain-containing protein [Aromatoleum toluclasticum]